MLVGAAGARVRAVAAFVTVVALGLAACSGSDGAAKSSSNTSSSKASGSTSGSSGASAAALDGFTPVVARTCRDLVAGVVAAGSDVGAQVPLYTDARSRLRATRARTPLDDQVLAYVEAQLAWLERMRVGGMRAAGPPPPAPPAASRCRAAGERLSAPRE